MIFQSKNTRISGKIQTQRRESAEKKDPPMRRWEKMANNGWVIG